ncbi:MAG: hypothetical protein FWC70_06945 [Defluviitaleaceae bacterium]|nr:hypothetical protein [Defluviitaleaceae bacterium]
MENEKPKKKKKSKLTTYVICGLVLLVAGGLFLDFGGIGSGIGIPVVNFGNDGDDAYESSPYEEDVPDDEPLPLIEPPTEYDEDEPETPPGYETPLLTIRVVESAIMYDGQELNTDELRALLTELHRPEYVWELHDERAIYAVHEEVRNLFAELNITFTQTAG